MTKSELRIKYTKQRETLSQDEVLSLSEKIFYNFLEEFKLVENQKVHCFLSMLEKKEIVTRFFMEYFFKNKIRVFVPKIFKGKLISVEITQETAFIKSFYGITEPESNIDSGEKDFDFVITPLLYCDQHGNRVGYGKGFYDEFFGSINPNSIKVGVGLFPPNESIDDIWEKDFPLDYLVTPVEVLSFLGLTSKSTK
ncbi:5-formyltetrahydrofolate cyclo-ligase [Kaistella jeonii]|uniref:5-formyltetrahydrofolate cyclo-ligase n=1 Tax=Kaistella jeonii TaxID=266749 RepID=A0A0C1FPJ6_9FLAO|nr:5-formyltetrahydrofolate cyclo-ligase [Kaistella jeonii]KIA89799.1 5-formyltetrahydrofolate cyclo-ligase [Kaistella jeonii]SFB86065.1 5-formyltetrahydrofolate cyclo-ligase [Kaistella jeonii]VEI96033.1 5-formyltetrahydrofolate cyclo-ligase family protein [Kaistella jeonii]